MGVSILSPEAAVPEHREAARSPIHLLLMGAASRSSALGAHPALPSTGDRSTSRALSWER